MATPPPNSDLLGSSSVLAAIQRSLTIGGKLPSPLQERDAECSGQVYRFARPSLQRIEGTLVGH